MNKETLNHLYSARWAISRAMEGLVDKIDYAIEELQKAKDTFISEPDRPSVTPEIIEEIQNPYIAPIIVQEPTVKYKTHGNYKTKTGNAKGVVVHYTVSGNNPVSVMQSLAGRGLGCPVMDHFGVIHNAKDFDIQKDVAWHAGESKWQGVSGISQYCIGLEICNWGRLDKKTDPYVKEVNERSSKGFQNIVEGKYEQYTLAQEQALINFCLWQLKVNPEFSIDWVVGHDEIAPGRKFDPGASLSMSMPQFREKLKALARK
jgi:N-acetylmuramoyl-L-alanine amidase